MCGLPPRENSHSPDKIWTTADCVEVCSVNSWPSAKPNSTMRECAVRSSVRLTMPLAANLVSSASDRIFSRATSIKGFSLMRRLSHSRARRELTQVKANADSDELPAGWKLSVRRMENRRRRLADGLGQFARLQNFCIPAPAQDPALHFGEAGKLHPQFRAAALQLAQRLRRMPFLFADIIGGARRETDDHVKLAFAGGDAEAVAQPFFERKFLRALKGLARRLHGLDARRDERAEV